MPRTNSTIERIRAELAWVSEELDPAKCSCRKHVCCEQEGHAVGECDRSPTFKFWTFRQEYFCDHCREYQVGGKRSPQYMTTP
jgi:hypothetical protein